LISERPPMDARPDRMFGHVRTAVLDVAAHPERDRRPSDSPTGARLAARLREVADEPGLPRRPSDVPRLDLTDASAATE